MKRKTTIAILVTLIAFVMISPAHAVPPAFGIKGDVGLTNLTGDVTGNKSMLSFGGGFLFQYMASPQFAIQPEAAFVLKGAKEDNPGGPEEKLKLTYVEIPVLVKFKPKMNGSIQPAIFAGPALGILVSAKAASVDVKDQFKSTDFGAVFGAGIELAAGAKGKVSFDARYALGLSNILKDSGDVSVKNGVASFNVSYLFQMGQ